MSILIVACLSVPASAQEGSGLYEPAPDPANRERAAEFVTSLRGASDVGEEELEHGLALGGDAAPAASPPAARAAGGRGFEPSPGWIPAMLLVLAAALVPPLLVARRA